MTSRDFCFWLQGYFELRKNKLCEITKEQADDIQKHLAMVFVHEIDPSQGSPHHQQELQAIHDGKPLIGGTGPGGQVMRC